MFHTSRECKIEEHELSITTLYFDFSNFSKNKIPAHIQIASALWVTQREPAQGVKVLSLVSNFAQIEPVILYSIFKWHFILYKGFTGSFTLRAEPVKGDACNSF